MRKTTFKQAVHGDNELLANTSEDAYRRGRLSPAAMVYVSAYVFFMESSQSDLLLGQIDCFGTRP